MTTLITKTPVKLCVVGVKKGNKYDFIDSNTLLTDNGHRADLVPLPPGKWSIAFLWSERTEELAKTIVQSVDYDVPPGPSNDFSGDWRTGYRDYDSDEETGMSEFPFVRTAIESIESLLKSEGLEVSEEWIILKQVI